MIKRISAFIDAIAVRRVVKMVRNSGMRAGIEESLTICIFNGIYKNKNRSWENILIGCRYGAKEFVDMMLRQADKK